MLTVLALAISVSATADFFDCGSCGTMCDQNQWYSGNMGGCYGNSCCQVVYDSCGCVCNCATTAAPITTSVTTAAATTTVAATEVVTNDAADATFVLGVTGTVTTTQTTDPTSRRLNLGRRLSNSVPEAEFCKASKKAYEDFVIAAMIPAPASPCVARVGPTSVAETASGTSDTCLESGSLSCTNGQSAVTKVGVWCQDFNTGNIAAGLAEYNKDRMASAISTAMKAYCRAEFTTTIVNSPAGSGTTTAVPTTTTTVAGQCDTSSFGTGVAAGDCGSTLASGSSCTPVCATTTEFLVTGDLTSGTIASVQCTDGTLTGTNTVGTTGIAVTTATLECTATARNCDIDLSSTTLTGTSATAASKSYPFFGKDYAALTVGYVDCTASGTGTRATSADSSNTDEQKGTLNSGYSCTIFCADSTDASIAAPAAATDVLGFQKPTGYAGVISCDNGAVTITYGDTTKQVPGVMDNTNSGVQCSNKT